MARLKQLSRCHSKLVIDKMFAFLPFSSLNAKSLNSNHISTTLSTLLTYEVNKRMFVLSRPSNILDLFKSIRTKAGGGYDSPHLLSNTITRRVKNIIRVFIILGLIVQKIIRFVCDLSYTLL